MPNRTIKVLITYDQQIIADGLACVLAKEKDIKVLSCLKNDESLLNNIILNEAEIIILELARWPNHYVSYIEEISNSFPNIKLLLISELINKDLLFEVMKIADGYMLRTCSAKKVIIAIHEIILSGKYLCPQEINEIVNRQKENQNSKLTSRENEILSQWLVLDDNNKIAQKLNICESTVRSHLKNIRQKIESNNKIQLLVYACKNNIINNGFKPICPNCKFSCKEINLYCN